MTTAKLPLGPVALEPASAALLGRLTAQLGRPGSATIAPGPVEEVEAGFHTVIPYDVIAVLAIEQRSLGDLFEFTNFVRTFYDSFEDGAVRQLGFDRVVLFAELHTNDPAEPRYAGFDKAPRRDRASIIEWVVRKPSVGRNAWSLAGYLEERWLLVGGDAPPFALAIEPPPEVVHYATHAKFGRGRVLSRADGKAVVEFADGKRTLAERFLVFES